MSTDLRAWTPRVKMALLGLLFLAAPLIAHATTCKGLTVTVTLPCDDVFRDFSDSNRDVIQGCDDAAHPDGVIMDQCDVFCGQDGNDELTIEPSICTGGIGYGLFNMGAGNDRIDCYWQCDGQGSTGNDTLHQWDEGCVIDFQGGDGNDNLILHGFDPECDAPSLYYDGQGNTAGGDTLNCMHNDGDVVFDFLSNIETFLNCDVLP